MSYLVRIASSKICKPKNLVCGFDALSKIASAFVHTSGLSCNVISALFAAARCGFDGSYAVEMTLSRRGISKSWAGSRRRCVAISMEAGGREVVIFGKKRNSLKTLLFCKFKCLLLTTLFIEKYLSKRYEVVELMHSSDKLILTFKSDWWMTAVFIAYCTVLSIGTQYSNLFCFQVLREKMEEVGQIERESAT